MCLISSGSRHPTNLCVCLKKRNIYIYIFKDRDNHPSDPRIDSIANQDLFDLLMFICNTGIENKMDPLYVFQNTGGFSVAFDPLDGSSIVDTNFTVGTIFGVWPGDKLTGVTGRDQVAAAMGIYGPRTTYVIALKDCPGTHEFLLLDES